MAVEASSRYVVRLLERREREGERETGTMEGTNDRCTTACSECLKVNSAFSGFKLSQVFLSRGKK